MREFIRELYTSLRLTMVEADPQELALVQRENRQLWSALLKFVLALAIAFVGAWMEVAFSKWALGTTGFVGLILSGLIIATIPEELSSKAGAFVAWLSLTGPMWFIFELQVNCAIRHACM